MATANEFINVSAKIKARLDTTNDANAKAIFEYCEKHYLLGAAGVFAAGVLFGNCSVLSQKAGLIIVAPSGQFKSQVLITLNKTFPKLTTWLKQKFTPTGMIKSIEQSKVTDTTFISGDLVIATDGNTKAKNAEIMGMLAMMLSDDEISRNNFENFRGESAYGRFGFMGACAMEAYVTLQKRIRASTLRQRIFVLNYELTKQDVRDRTVRLDAASEMPVKLSGCPRIMKRVRVTVPLKQNEKGQMVNQYLWDLVDDFENTYGADASNMRYETLFTSWLHGYAILNGRKEVILSDFDVLKEFFPLIRPQEFQLKKAKQKRKGTENEGVEQAPPDKELRVSSNAYETK